MKTQDEIETLLTEAIRRRDKMELNGAAWYFYDGMRRAYSIALGLEPA